MPEISKGNRLSRAMRSHKAHMWAMSGDQQLALTFNSQDEALAHASRLMKLQKGDVVQFRAEDGVFRKGVFGGTLKTSSYHAQVFVYDDDDTLFAIGVPWFAIDIPPEEAAPAE